MERTKQKFEVDIVSNTSLDDKMKAARNSAAILHSDEGKKSPLNLDLGSEGTAAPQHPQPSRLNISSAVVLEKVGTPGLISGSGAPGCELEKTMTAT